MTLTDKRLIKSAWQARATASREQERSQIHVPDELDVKGVRSRLNMTQDDFASVYGFTINQIRNWEQSRVPPLGGTAAYLMLIEREPEVVSNILDKIRQEDRADRQSCGDNPIAI